MAGPASACDMLWCECAGSGSRLFPGALKEKSPADKRGRLIARGKLGNARERWRDISDIEADAIGHFHPKQYASKEISDNSYLFRR